VSTLNVDKVDPSTGTTLELGTSGDTINIPSGVTIANSGTATGFGAVLTGSTNNTITTVTGANAIQGEANLTWDGSADPPLLYAEGQMELRHNSDAPRRLIIDADRAGYGNEIGEIEFKWNNTAVAKISGTAGEDTTNKDEGNVNISVKEGGGSYVNAFHVKQNANIGIGETEPLSKLHVKTGDSGQSTLFQTTDNKLVLEDDGEVAMTMLGGTTSGGHICIGASDDADAMRITYDMDNNRFLLYTENSERMRIDSSGHIHMPDDSDTGRIDIMSGYANPQIILRGPATTNSNKMVFFNGNGEVGSIATSGSATAFNTSSDYRLKENETSITDGIDRIKQLKPYRFNFKTDETKTVDGFFAHEVSGIVPEAISGDKDAMHPEVLYTAKDELPEGKNIGDVKEETTINPQGIDQSKLVPLLTSALQEAITKIETLETKVTALENA
jgi:hypothetical protein